MKNLLNCHCLGVHSFVLSQDKDGLLRRVFYADTDHTLWRPFEVAVHPHHVDLKITVLEGTLYNPIYERRIDGTLFKKYNWNSHILSGKGGFELTGEERLLEKSNLKYVSGQSVSMFCDELHTVCIERSQMCVWLVEEEKPSREYNQVNYSIHDLTKWSPEGLYIEVDDSVRDKYLNRFYKKIEELIR